MSKTVKTISYFDEFGPQNTEDVIDCVARTVKETGIRDVIVASTTGNTGLKWAEELDARLIGVNLVVVSWKAIDQSIHEKLKSYGVKVIDQVNAFENLQDVANAYRSITQGFKVAVEDALIVGERKIIEPYKYVISVGGTGSGSDTALIVKVSTLSDRMGKDFEKRLTVREIIAMPAKKKWWE